MIIEEQGLLNYLFDGLNYEKYIKGNALHDLVGVDLTTYGVVEAKQIRDPYHSVNPNLSEPLAPELDDLCRLHFLIVSRKVTTILEFGLGKSTIVFNDALSKNRDNYERFVKKNLRRSNRFECHCVDNSEKWIDRVRSANNLKCVRYHYSDLEMGTFNDRICTYYSKVPNICPDFIYLDGPAPIGDYPDRFPMAADILVFEHFLPPGTLLVTDGRTANARFLKANLQRDWIYCHDEASDQHFFELSETPLGIYNRRQIDFCLGESFYNRLGSKV
jgi:hypothetical protein